MGANLPPCRQSPVAPAAPSCGAKCVTATRSSGYSVHGVSVSSLRATFRETSRPALQAERRDLRRLRQSQQRAAAPTLASAVTASAPCDTRTVELEAKAPVDAPGGADVGARAGGGPCDRSARDAIGFKSSDGVRAASLGGRSGSRHQGAGTR